MHPFIRIGSVALPSYGVMIAAAILLCGPLGCWRMRRSGGRWENALVIMACAFGFGMAGAALLYLLVTYSLQDLLLMLRTFRLPEGGTTGLVFFGGLLAVFPGALLGCRMTGVRLQQAIPPLLPIIPIGHALGRIGCFLAGCCYGKPTSLPIGVVYTQSITGVPTGVPLLPVQLMEAALLLIIFVLLLTLAYRWPPLRLLGIYAVSYSLCRFALETLRYDSIRGIYGVLSTSQWISLGLFAVGILLMLPSRRRQTPSAHVC